MREKLFLFIMLVISSLNVGANELNGLYYNTFGKESDPSIIFIHGGPGFNSYDFEITTAESLAQLGYYVVTYDQRGQGRSQLTAIENYNYKIYANDIKLLIDKLKLKNPVLIGHSHGGPIAIQFEKYFPNVVKKIVLLSAPIYFTGIMKSILENCSRNALLTNNNELATASSYLYQHLVVNPVTDLQVKINLTLWLFNMGAGYCDLYKVKNPTLEEVAIKSNFNKYPKQPDIAGAKGVAEFIQNENYLYLDQTSFVSKNRNRFCGIYGAEDGLFTPLELQNIESILNGVKVIGNKLTDDGINRFQVISGASHAIYINQQKSFFSSLQLTCGI